MNGNPIFNKGIRRERAEDDVNRTTLLSAASQAVAQVAKDSEKGVRGVHEIQVTLRKYEFSPWLAAPQEGRTGQADHGLRRPRSRIQTGRL